MDKGFSPDEPKPLDGMIHTDHLGTPQIMTNSSGAVVWSAYYKAFGAATVTVSTITNNLRFPGQYYDAETGLNYNYFRDYNPVIGNYIEPDRVNLKSLQLPLPLFKAKIHFPNINETNLKKILTNYSLYHPQTQNPYPYVDDNPNNRTDPDGEFWPEIIIGIIISGLIAEMIYSGLHPEEEPPQHIDPEQPDLNQPTPTRRPLEPCERE